MGLFDFKPLIKQEQDDSKKKSVESGLSIEEKANISGVDGASRVAPPNPRPSQGGDDKLIAGPHSTFISLGKDMPGGPESGRVVDAGAIWICAGMSSALSDKAPKTSAGIIQECKRNFNMDASFIYASAKSDIDKYLNLSPGSVGNPENSACIAIKSSDLRFVARNGIKLVTGTDKRNALGGGHGTIVGIDIIAGNDDSSLQPMVKGDNLVEALKSLCNDVLVKIVATVEVLVKHQKDLNDKIGTHKHKDLPLMCINAVATGNPMSTNEGDTFPDPELLFEAQKTSGFFVGHIMKDCNTHTLNMSNWCKRWLGGTEGDYICSPYNKVN